ncbi:MAG: hypothetical protein WAM43_16560 [Terriglobales bacterium]
MILPYLAIALLLLVTVYSAVVSFRQPGLSETSKWIFPTGVRRPARMGVGIGTFALLTGLTLWLSMGARHSSRHPSRFLIPEGFVGWLRVEFEVGDAPPLRIEGSDYLIKFPPSGLLRTSSPEEFGWAKDHYFYYSDKGTRPLPDSGPAGDRMIWGNINGEGSGVQGKKKYEEFFVGTEQQFKQQMRGEEAGDSTPRTPSK